MGQVTIEDLRSWLRRAGKLMDAHAAELTELDAAIGDADHGSNMKRGFDAIAPVLEDDSLDTVDALMKKVAMTLISSVGGAAGPLYGTFFLRFATSQAGAMGLDAQALAAGVEAGVGGIAQRGKATEGEKTMLDAWYPALRALQEEVGRRGGDADVASTIRAAAEAAAAGRDATMPLKATKGRASYLGDRSVGHIDPGAASTALLWQAAVEAIEQREGRGAPDDGGTPGEGGTR